MSELTAACFGRDFERDGWPTVSVVVPIRNEAEHLERAVASILAQEYPRDFDICLAVAPSDDGTEALAAAISEREPRVSVVANPAGVTPAGLNASIAATTGEVVVRVDGHAELSTGYIRRAVETMCRTAAVNVGGMQVPSGETPFEEAVAAATTSWLGTGGARYRVGGVEGPVDTVFLGVFDRAAGDSVGWFDETLIRNQDYEFNIRLRRGGGTVWFDPELAAMYRPRGSFRALAKQYYEYGWWKAEVAWRHPESLRLRQVVPAAVTALVIGSLTIAPRAPRLLALPAGYWVALLLATRRRRWSAKIVAVMHMTWGAGFLLGAAKRAAAWRSRATGPSVRPRPSSDGSPAR